MANSPWQWPSVLTLLVPANEFNSIKPALISFNLLSIQVSSLKNFLLRNFYTLSFYSRVSTRNFLLETFFSKPSNRDFQLETFDSRLFRRHMADQVVLLASLFTNKPMCIWIVDPLPSNLIRNSLSNLSANGSWPIRSSGQDRGQKRFEWEIWKRNF